MASSTFRKLGRLYRALRAQLAETPAPGPAFAAVPASSSAGVAEAKAPAWLAATYTQPSVAGQPARTGVFVFGCPRSGTSVLSWALAAHPDFWTSAESDFLHYLYGQGRLHQAYQTAYNRADRGWLRANHVTYPEFAAAAGMGLNQLFLSRAGNRRWVDSDPGYLLMAGDLALMFPQAHFIHIVRDGRAVVCSLLKSGFDFPWAKDFTVACETWVHYVRAGRAFQQGHPARAIQVHLERLSAAPAAEFDALLAFLGAPPSERPAHFLQTNRINSSYGNAQPEDIRKRKAPEVIPQAPWQAWNKANQQTFSKICGAAMQELGYTLD